MPFNVKRSILAHMAQERENRRYRKGPLRGLPVDMRPAAHKLRLLQRLVGITQGDYPLPKTEGATTAGAKGRNKGRVRH